MDETSAREFVKLATVDIPSGAHVVRPFTALSLPTQVAPRKLDSPPRAKDSRQRLNCLLSFKPALAKFPFAAPATEDAVGTQLDRLSEVTPLSLTTSAPRGTRAQLAAGALSKDLISAFKSTKIHVKKDGLVSIDNTDTSKDSAALVALLSALADKP